jgi:hypothetical protein
MVIAPHLTAGRLFKISKSAGAIHPRASALRGAGNGAQASIRAQARTERQRSYVILSEAEGPLTFSGAVDIARQMPASPALLSGTSRSPLGKAAGPRLTGIRSFEPMAPETS